MKVFELLGGELRFVALEVDACCGTTLVAAMSESMEGMVKNEGVDGEEGGDGSF